MAILTILQFPDSRLRTKAKPVTVFGTKLQQVVDNMKDTMYDANGIGLAATQVNIHQQILVIDVSETRDQPLVFINPAIEVLNNELESYQEGCLSVPGFYEDVNRPNRVSVSYCDMEGHQQVLEPTGLLAVCLQHEIDHLNGKLFVDYLSTLKRQRIRKQLEKQQHSA